MARWLNSMEWKSFNGSSLGFQWGDQLINAFVFFFGKGLLLLQWKTFTIWWSKCTSKISAMRADMLARIWSKINYRFDIYRLICSSLNLEDSKSARGIRWYKSGFLTLFQKCTPTSEKNQFIRKLLNRLDFTYFKYVYSFRE